ncbi:MAG: hypothetical protein UR23_C0034G0004 [Candidatus Roizmanbacteria bacterium GW2011_GWA2_32_13]|uniref:Pilus assembly protein, PilO n=1 Tax=Candidatus Roizmanbacteria bacterium GW2011_GWA2_32_13 TaxID=1618475 RepID=A0A0G0BU65_9BACT|nr:MAG: hypothetical protein UR23_C0034G0004 [Candidatus Roizmanbacteria bacterium GW2011_GWA2_32_13]
MIKRQGLIFFIASIISLILLFFVFWGSIGDVFSNFKKYRSIANEEQDLKKLVNNKTQLEEKFKKLKEKAYIIPKIISNERNISNIISQFNDMILRSGLVLNKISVSPVNNGLINITAEVRGSINSLEKLVIFIETNLPFIDIKLVDFLGGKIGSQLFIIKAKSYVSEIDINDNMKAEELSSSLEKALKIDLGFIQNESLSNFKEYGNIPVELPKDTEIGNDNPYES